MDEEDSEPPVKWLRAGTNFDENGQSSSNAPTSFSTSIPKLKTAQEYGWYFPQEKIENDELQWKIQQLEQANNQLQAEKKFFESRALAHEPTLKPSQVHTVNIKVDADAKLTDWTTTPFEVDGVEFYINIKDPNSKGRRRSPHYGYPSPSGNGLVKFIPIVRPETDPDTPRSVLFLTTVTQRLRECAMHTGKQRDAVRCSSQMQVFMDKAGKISGKQETFKPTSDLNSSETTIRLTIVVQKLEGISDGTMNGDMTVVPVVVHGKEFRVRKAYLSQWSYYFRVYFDAPMAEKKEGVFPVKDPEITADDFQEMLMVILPTQKPVSVENFETLLKLARRFEMPDLRRKVELFLIDFERHSLSKAKLFLLATDKFDLPFVQAVLLHRWSDPELLKAEMITSPCYELLEPITKNLINQLLAESSIANFNVRLEQKLQVVYLSSRNSPESRESESPQDFDDDEVIEIDE